MRAFSKPNLLESSPSATNEVISRSSSIAHTAPRARVESGNWLSFESPSALQALIAIVVDRTKVKNLKNALLMSALPCTEKNEIK